MKVIATIPGNGKVKERFEGVLVALKPGEKLSFLHLDYRKLVDDLSNQSERSEGRIPIIIHDDKNNLAALTVEASGDNWKSTTLEGWINEAGKWVS